MYPFLGTIKPVSFISSTLTTTEASGTADITVAKPSNVQKNDLIVLILSTRKSYFIGNLPSTISWPSGFTEFANIPSNNNQSEFTGPPCQIGVSYKIATASEGASYTVSDTLTGLAAGLHCLIFRNANLVTPLNLNNPYNTSFISSGGNSGSFFGGSINVSPYSMTIYFVNLSSTNNTVNTIEFTTNPTNFSTILNATISSTHNAYGIYYKNELNYDKSNFVDFSGFWQRLVGVDSFVQSNIIFSIQAVK
jgi:hypothetical protein